jgi:hypothetical protein
MSDGTDPVAPDETIYRRVFAGNGYFDPNRIKAPLSAKAFRPMSDEPEGISVTRAKYVHRAEDAAAYGYVGKSYYLIELTAADVISLGVTIHPDPLGPYDLGHALLPEVNVTVYRQPPSRS